MSSAGPSAYVIAANIRRRHLTPRDRVLLAQKALEAERAFKKQKPTSGEASPLVGATDRGSFPGRSTRRAAFTSVGDAPESAEGCINSRAATASSRCLRAVSCHSLILNSRQSGFPCRDGGCTFTVRVPDSSSLTAIHDGSAARREHELAEHALDIPKAEPERTWSMAKSVDRLRIGRRARSAVPGRVS